MTEPSEPVEVQPEVADLTEMSLKKIAEAEGDPLLEQTLERLRGEASNPREPVSGFASAI